MKVMRVTGRDGRPAVRVIALDDLDRIQLADLVTALITNGRDQFGDRWVKDWFESRGLEDVVVA